MPTTKAPANNQWTTSAWAAVALKKAGKPVTANNVQNLQRWINAETGGQQGGWARDNNPLNMTGYGSHPPANSSTFYSFSDLNAAADAFAGFMKQSNMSGISAALSANAPAPMFSAAVVASPWAGGHYGGSPTAIAKTPPAADAPTTKNGGPGLLGQIGNAAWDVANTATFGALGAGSSAIDTASAFVTLASDLTSPTWWRRIGIGAAGLAVMTVGLVVFFASTNTGQETVTAAGTAALL
jgi:hypothetical protein